MRRAKWRVILLALRAKGSGRASLNSIATAIEDRRGNWNPAIPEPMPSRNQSADPAFSVVLEHPPGRRDPALSVIITTPDSYATISNLVAALRAQTARDALELVILAPSANAVRSGIADFKDFCGWRIVEIDALRSVAQAKAAGIRCATAPLVVLTEDHSLPDPGWARALIDAHRDNWAAVGPAM